MYRLRVGNFRIIYTIDDNVLLIDVINTDNRGQIYKNMQQKPLKPFSATLRAFSFISYQTLDEKGTVMYNITYKTY